jgi:phasin protein
MTSLRGTGQEALAAAAKAAQAEGPEAPALSSVPSVGPVAEPPSAIVTKRRAAPASGEENAPGRAAAPVKAAATGTAAQAERPAPLSAPSLGPVAQRPAAIAKKRRAAASGAENAGRAAAPVKAPAKETIGHAKRRGGSVGREMQAMSALVWWPRLDWRDGANALATVNAALVRGAAAFCEEMFYFANARLRHNVETSQNVSRCKSPTEFLETQADYARTATEQYLVEPIKLIDLAAKATMESWAPVQRLAQPAGETAGREGARS